jgi:hypothetical protein
MGYDLVPILIGLAIMLVVGVILVIDAVRRAITEGRERNHDLHV